MNEPAKYLVRRIQVDAIQWTADNEDACRKLARSFYEIDPVDRANSDDPEETGTFCETVHSTWVGLRVGDWIVRGTSGLLFRKRADEFEREYMPAVVNDSSELRFTARHYLSALRRSIERLNVDDERQIMYEVSKLLEEYDDRQPRNAGVTMTPAEAARRREAHEASSPYDLNDIGRDMIRRGVWGAR